MFFVCLIMLCDTQLPVVFAEISAAVYVKAYVKALWRRF